MTDGPDLQAVGARVEELLAQLSSSRDPAVPRDAEELVGLLVDFHGAGLARVMDVGGEQSARTLVADPLVAGQLELHGLMPGSPAPDVEPDDPAELAARIETLLAELTADDVEGSELVEELVALVVDFYGAGLARITELVSYQALCALLDDPLVASQLILHGLHPQDTEERVRAALEKVRPYLGSHAGDVHYRGIDDNGVVQLALAGSCDGCPSSAVTVKLAIEKAIEDAAPEVAGVEVAGMVRETPVGGRRMLPISAVGAPAPPPEPEPVPMASTWVSLDGMAGLAVGGVRVTRIGQLPTVVCNVGGTLYAYADRCPGCGDSVAGAGGTAARLDGDLLACGRCGLRYDVRLAGRAVDGVLHLDPLPLLADNGRVRVAVPTRVPVAGT